MMSKKKILISTISSWQKSWRFFRISLTVNFYLSTSMKTVNYEGRYLKNASILFYHVIDLMWIKLFCRHMLHKAKFLVKMSQFCHCTLIIGQMIQLVCSYRGFQVAYRKPRARHGQLRLKPQTINAYDRLFI